MGTSQVAEMFGLKLAVGNIIVLSVILSNVQNEYTVYIR